MSPCSRACEPAHLREEKDALKIQQQASHCLTERQAQLSASPHLVFLCFASKSVLAFPRRGWVGRAEWGPLPTSPLPTAEYPKCIHPKGWQTAVSLSFCFLRLFPCDYSCLSAEPAPQNDRHCLLHISGSGSCSRVMVQPCAAIQDWPRAQRGRRSTRPVMAALLWSSCPPAP